MLLNDALSYFGTKRSIWIDDLFNQNPTEVANLLLNSWETAIQCDFQDLDAILKKAEFAIDVARVELTEKLAELDSNRIREIKDAFFAREMLSEEGFVSKE